jgi:hypothetical protein
MFLFMAVRRHHLPEDSQPVAAHRQKTEALPMRYRTNHPARLPP